jgi:hypothetical protein
MSAVAPTEGSEGDTSVVSVVICFTSLVDYSSALAPKNQREVCPLSRGVMFDGSATPIRPITGRPSLSPSSFADHTIRPSYEIPSCDQGHDRFITFRICTTHGLGFASPPVTVLSASRELGTLEPATYLLVKLVSIFSSCRSRRLSAIHLS